MKNLNQAYRELYNRAVLGNDEETGARKIQALDKAVKLLENGLTFSFDGDKLNFTSPDSGKQRNVTSFGCADSCDCKNAYSYHQAAFDLLTRERQLTELDRLIELNDRAAVLVYRSEQNGRDIKAATNGFLSQRAKEEMDSSYLKPTVERKIERIGSVRI